jgi:hypothetical protein
LTLLADFVILPLCADLNGNWQKSPDPACGRKGIIPHKYG